MAFTISRSGGESIRTESWRYTHWGYGQKGVELFDRAKDPGEFKNLAGDPAYRKHERRLRELLLAKRKAAGFKR